MKAVFPDAWRHVVGEHFWYNRVMFEWTPPPRSMAIVNIDAYDGPYHESLAAPGRMTVLQRDLVRGELLNRFGLKQGETFIKIPVADPRLVDLVSAVAESRANKMLCLRAGWIEEPARRASDAGTWFGLLSGASEFKSPRRAPAGSHFGWRSGQYVASEAFRRAVDDAALSGLAWLPLEDARADDPMLWYDVFAEQPIGRGLDHPLIDKVKLDASQQRQGFDRARRWGQPFAWLKHFRSDVVIRSEGVVALAKPATAHFRVVGPHRYVQEFLPATDFAYREWGFEMDAAPGPEGRRGRSICCNARARAVLIDAGVMKPSRFEPLATVPERDAISEILDRVVPGPIPLPKYTREEAQIECTRRERNIALRLPSTPITTFHDVDAALKHMARLADAGTLPWAPAGGTAEFEAIRKSSLFASTPTAWQQLAPYLPLELSITDPETSETFDFALQSPTWNEWLAYEPGESPPEEEPSTDDLVIANTPNGDWFAFRNSDDLLPLDARIVHWDHETTSIAEEWATVLALVAHLLDLGFRGGKPA